MTANGAFTFVLHSHLPYARRAGRWPHGEEWIHEAASETYLPLIEMLRGLPPSDAPYLTLGLTPVLVEQLADGDVLANLVEFMDERRVRAAADVRRFTEAGDELRARTAAWYERRFASLLRLLDEALGGDIVGAFRALQDEGVIEIATSAATHGYLPLMARDSTIRAQIGVGVRAYERHFGRPPRSFWLPECAYRPAYYVGEGSARRVRPGLESFLQDAGLRVFFVETHTVEGGAPAGKAAGDAVGPYGEIVRRWVAPPPLAPPPTPYTTYHPYRVGAATVAALARDKRTGLQVWSAQHGYPGDARYREFHKRDGVSGLHYWRVTGPETDLGDKEGWDADAAFALVEAHAEHYARLVAELLAANRRAEGEPGIIAAAYDTELFGHWWFEGVDWLGHVLTRLHAEATVELTSAGTYVGAHPPAVALNLPESSWGQGGNHFTWDNAATHWMWPIIHAAEARMERLAAGYAAASPAGRAAIAQAAREALLLQSSDWPFLITTGQADEYAAERFRGHVERFERLCALVERGDADAEAAAAAREYFALDNIYPEIDVALFGPDGDEWSVRRLRHDGSHPSSRDHV